MLEMYRRPFVRGFTTNPTLMRKAGIRERAYDLVNRLSHDGVKVNVTTILTLEQVEAVAPSCVSVALETPAPAVIH